MSMYRQFWLALFTSMLLAFGGSLIASLLSARAYLESQLSIKNADNASALALSLSLSNPEPATIELTTTALFDSGHYELIRVVDPEGHQIVERVGVVDDRDAPQWFMRWLPIHATPGQAKINNEVQQVGTVTVVSHNHFAYAMLWGSVWPTIAAMTFACLVGGSLGAIILGRLKAPLQAVIDQATAITERRFVTIDEPAVPELKHLALAMNATIRRLRTMFQDEAARLETLRREANFDPLTGLANRNHFMARLRQALDAEDAGEGTLLLIRLADLAGVNRRLGRDTTDEFLRCAGEVIAGCPAVGSQGLAARLNGADFAILLTGESDAQATASGLLAALIEAGRPFVNDRAVAWIAIGRFGQGTDIAALLARVDRALATAEVEGGNSIYEAVVDVASPLPRNADQWSQVITRALDGQGLRLGSFPVLDTCGRLSHRESPLRLLTTENGEWLTAGSFLPIAERLKLTPGARPRRRHAGLAGPALRTGTGGTGNQHFGEFGGQRELPGAATAPARRARRGKFAAMAGNQRKRCAQASRRVPRTLPRAQGFKLPHRAGALRPPVQSDRSAPRSRTRLPEGRCELRAGDRQQSGQRGFPEGPDRHCPQYRAKGARRGCGNRAGVADPDGTGL
jgi:diguanylate cyclase (GGDEF)-like protein